MENKNFESFGLLERGKNDLIRSEELFQEKSDYELAAYLAQQALEKYVKSYMLKNKVIDDPEKLKHIQIIGILILIKDDTVRLRRQHNKSKQLFALIEHYLTFLDDIITFYKKIRDEPEVKISVWKYSLNMLSKEDEEGLFPDFLRKFSRDGNRIKTSSNSFHQKIILSNIDQIESKLGIPRERILEFATKFTQMGDMISKLDPQISKENQDLIIKGLKLLQEVEQAQSDGKIDPNDNELKSNSLSILGEIAEFSSIIIKSFPHEEIARYPTLIDTVSSTIIYKNHKDDLWSLIQEIKLGCNEIERRILS